jgi:hypothetical protein
MRRKTESAKIIVRKNRNENKNSADFYFCGQRLFIRVIRAIRGFVTYCQNELPGMAKNLGQKIAAQVSQRVNTGRESIFCPRSFACTSVDLCRDRVPVRPAMPCGENHERRERHENDGKTTDNTDDTDLSDKQGI